ncbi:helix-turn-helix domain-containing protein, partial [Nonomuraea pusilla]
MHTTEWDRDLLRETLHEIMERAELNQAAVGRLAGRDRTMANRWLGGQHRPTYESAIRFTQAIAEQYPALSQLGDQF